MDLQDFLISLVILVFWIGISLYYFYRSWIDPQGLKETFQRDVKRLPSWYPTKGYSLAESNKANWHWIIRILSTFSLLLSLIILLLVIIYY